MRACAGWTLQRPGLLEDEVQRVLAAFPTLIAAVGRPLDDERCWVEAAEPVLCPTCAELVVFDRGTRCAACETPREAPRDALVGFVGRVPALIEDRPLLAGLRQRLEALRARGDPRAEHWERALLRVEGRAYLAPRYAMWLSRSWPHADPPVMVWPEYFEMLDIPADHVYYAGEYYRLCLYATWRERPAVEVLQGRVVPRLLIDLMVADLQARGRLDQALERLQVSLYELYNMVGRAEQTAALQQIYAELM